ncbi:MAG: TonB-dependent receptor [Cellulophaga sp.]
MIKKDTIYKLFIMGVFLFGGSLFAQTVTGVVSDANGPLPGVSVVEKGTTNGTATDFDGLYIINELGSNAVLVFSSIGYTTAEISVDGKSTVNVVLTEDLQALDEVVLVGYTSRKKSTITGAVSTVEMSDLEKTRVTDVSQALQGQIAGVQVTSSSGAPGDPIQIRIRGEGTIGNNNPLYVIDGIASRDISFLNQADIKTMTVLKDAAAAAIYGSRASGGVVLITTKSGVKGKVSFNADYYYGINNVTNLPNMLNADQYINTLEKAWSNTFTGANPYTADRGRSDFSDTDWLDELFETGHSQNLQFTASGGSDKVQFLTSLGYYSQDGTVIFDNDKYQKLNFRTNINADLTDRFKIGTNLQLSYSKQDKIASRGESLIRFALLRAPVLAVYKDVNDPTYSERDPFTDMPFFTPTGYDAGLQRTMYEMVGNPIAQAFFTDDVRKIYKTFGNVYGEYAFLKNKELKFRTNAGIDLSFFHNKAFNENYGDDDGGGSAIDQGLGRRNRPNNLGESRGEAFTFTFNNTLSYAKNFNDRHDFSAMIGTEYITNYDSSIGASRARFPFTNDEFRYLDFGGADLNVWNSGSASEWTLFSYFGSTSYVLDNKYMITANLRTDASSRFSENNRWGYFPSVSAGWKISDENFLKDVDWLTNFKIRASWGQLGNQEIDNYTYLTLISQTDGIVKTDRFGNPDLKWETTTQSNIGLDVALFNNKLALTAEYFQKNTTDILLPINLPSVVGNVQPTILNAGEVSNNGFEFSVNYKNSDNEFKYSINANMATLTNNVEKLHPNLPNIPNGVTRTIVGQPLNAYYGYRMIGIYQNQAEVDAHLNGSTAKPGDIKFNDLNGDGVISADKDREYIGSPIPELTYGLSFSSSYKGFDFSFLFQGVEGVDRYNDGKKIVDYDTRPFNYTTTILGAWDGDGSSNTIPRVAFEDNGSSKTSSIFVEDASYLRLKNIELGYTIDSVKGLQSIRFYLSGQNLFTSTDYSGLDPETVDLTDKGTYPSSKSILYGINVKF